MKNVNMARAAGIDFGTKRIGIAVSDEDGRIAFPREVVPADWEALRHRFGALIKEENIEFVVVGLAKDLSGRSTVMTDRIKEFVEKFESEFHLPVHLENEILSTKAALRGSQKKSMLDASAAALILQGWLDRKNRDRVSQSEDS